MTRHSRHSVTAVLVNTAGAFTVLPATLARVRLNNSRYPYGEASCTFPLPEGETLETFNPRTGLVRLLLDIRESTGDPVQVREITADHGGSMAQLTAAFAGHVSAVSQAYWSPWNDDAIPGSAMRGNFVVVDRTIDHQAHTVTLTGYTDEALLSIYRLVAKQPETSGSNSVRDTVNYALRKIGAALQPGPTDALIEEVGAIVWEPGVTAWDYVRGIAEAAGLVVRCDERRRWTLTRRDARRPETVVLARSTQITEQITLDGDRYADAVVVRYEWTDTAGDKRVRYDTASRSAEPTKVVQVERSTPYPGPGAADYWLKRLSSRGRVFEMDQVSDYSYRPGMQFTASVPATPTALGYLEQIEWILPEATAHITTVDAVDAVEGAIDLFPEGLYIDNLVGMIAGLNPGSELAA